LAQSFKAETTIFHRIAVPMISYQEPVTSGVLHQITSRAFQELPVIGKHTQGLSLPFDVHEFPRNRMNVWEGFENPDSPQLPRSVQLLLSSGSLDEDVQVAGIDKDPVSAPPRDLLHKTRTFQRKQGFRHRW